MSDRTRKLALVLLTVLAISLLAAGCCSSAIVGDMIRMHIEDQVEEQVYREKLGIGNSDKEVVAFVTQELKGLTHEEALERLSRWGEVEVVEESCSLGQLSGRCVVTVDSFLETRRGYEFTVFYRNSKVDSVAIYYS